MKNVIRNPLTATLIAVLGATLVTYGFGWSLVRSSSVAHAFAGPVATIGQAAAEAAISPLLKY